MLFSYTQPLEPIPIPITTEMFTTTPQNLAFIQRDPLRLKYATARFFWESHRFDGYIDSLISSLQLPVEIFLAGRDTLIDNEGVRSVLERGGQDKLEIVTLRRSNPFHTARRCRAYGTGYGQVAWTIPIIEACVSSRVSKKFWLGGSDGSTFRHTESCSV